MIYTVNLQSPKTVDRVAFSKALRVARKHRIRAVRKASETNEWGHVRTYRVEGRWEASNLAEIANNKGLCSWQS